MIDERLKGTPEAERETELLIERARREGNAGLIEEVIKDPNLSPVLKSKAEETYVACLAAQAELSGGAADLAADNTPYGENKPDAADADPTSTLARIASLSVVEKIKLALFGTKEERFILLRSANKIVATTVLKSPKLSENEVEMIAQMRNVSQDVLQTVGSKREWVSNYKVVLALIKNPRTPTGLALRLLNRVTTKDLSMLSRDRSIAEIVRKTAARVLAKKATKKD